MFYPFLSYILFLRCFCYCEETKEFYLILKINLGIKGTYQVEKDTTKTEMPDLLRQLT